MIPVPPVPSQNLAVRPGAHQEPPSTPKTLPNYPKFPESPPVHLRNTQDPHSTHKTYSKASRTNPDPQEPPSTPEYTSGHTRTPRKKALRHHEGLRKGPEKSAEMLREPLWKKNTVLELNKHLRRDSEGTREGLRGLKRYQKVLGHNKDLQRGPRWYCGVHRARCGVP